MSKLGFRCSSLAADYSLKRIVKSESMRFEEVKCLYMAVQKVVKHFSCNVKCKELLEKAMEINEMEKGVLLIYRHATRMGHFLTACDKSNSLLVPLYNIMYSCGTMKEGRD